MRPLPLSLTRFALALSQLLFLTIAEASEGSRTVYPARAEEHAVLVIKGAADTAALQPLILDFQQIAPHITVEYTDFISNDLYRDADQACQGKQAFADIILSSAVDQMVKLANDGCAMQQYVSQEPGRHPSYRNWRNEVFGFTFEPAVFVYRSDKVVPEDVPHTRGELADLLRRKPELYGARVATYDLRQSGVGYLLAFQDAEQNSTAYGRLLESMSRARAQLRCCNNLILTDLAKGDVYIGYNILGSYAHAAAREHPELKIVLPRDYTLVLSRAALVPPFARQTGLGAQFLNYLLSPRGQEVGRDNAFAFSDDGPKPDHVDGPWPLIESGVGRQIRIGPGLLATQDDAQRQRFIQDWIEVMVAK